MRNNKLAFKLYLYFFSIFFGVTISYTAYFSVTNIPNNDTLSVREKPTTNSKKIGEIAFNATRLDIKICDIFSKDKNPERWCKYTILGEGIYKEGWIADKYIKMSNDYSKQDAEYENKTYEVFECHLFLYYRDLFRYIPWTLVLLIDG